MKSGLGTFALALAPALYLLGSAAVAADETTGAQEQQLAPIDVEADKPGTAWDPVDGYVAERSAGATKTDTPLIETPQSVSVIASDQIEAQNAGSVREVLRYVGGVLPEIRGNVASRYDQLTLRGFQPDQYLDGLILQSNYYIGPQVDPYLLERVEVIKGPSSVLYGLAPPGGLINLVTKRPTADPIRDYRIKFGSDSRAGLGFDIGGAATANGDLQYRVVGNGFRRDGPQRTVETSRYSIAPSLSWQLSSSTDVTFLASYRADPDAGAYGALPSEGTVEPNPVVGRISNDFYDGDPNFEDFDRKQTMAGYELSHWFSDALRFKQNFRYQRSEIDYKSVYGAGLQADNRTLNRGTAASDEKLDGFTVDNQLQGYFDTGAVAHTVLAGVDHRNGDARRYTGFGAAPTLDLVDPEYGQAIAEPARTRFDFDRDQTGFYLQDQVKLGRWVGLLGGRYDSVQVSQSDENGNRETRRDHAFTGRTGLLYRFDNGIAPFVSYTESFQPPNAFGVSSELGKPTEGTQYEAGVKYQPPRTNALLTASLFELTQSNVSTPDPDVPNVSVQTGEVRIRGAEIEARASLLNGLDFSAAATYLDSEVTKDNPDAAGNTDEGNDFAQTPEMTASLWLDYTTPSGPWAGFGGGFGIRLVGKQYATNANDLEVDAYTIADAVLHYDLGGWNRHWRRWRVALNVQNLFDQRHVTSCYSRNACFLGYEREVTATVAYRWD